MWYTAPGKLSSFLVCLSSSASFPMLILCPKSALATILVTLKPSNFIFLLVNFLISFEIFWAAKKASSSDSEPMIIILPDLKIKMVLLGLVFLSITAGNLFLLYLDPETFQAISFNSRLALPYILSQGSSRAKETTFCTVGSAFCFDILLINFSPPGNIQIRPFFFKLWVPKKIYSYLPLEIKKMFPLASETQLKLQSISWA